MAESLTDHGFQTQICDSLGDSCAELHSGAGALLLTEEALELANVYESLLTLKTQPPWSELPVIILTTGGESRLARLLELTAAAAGSVTLLERPIGTTTLIRSLEVAMNSRRRQYQVRDLLEEQRRSELELRQAHEELADRARQLSSLVELRTAKLVKSNEQLRHEIAERRQAEAVRELLRRQLLGAQEEERRRIARELHDQMGQNLTALNVGLKSLLDADRARTLNSVVRPLQELAAQTARDLHRVALELRPPALDDFGLVKAVRNLTETWSVRCGIEVDLEARKYRSIGISPEFETTIYRIIQEALNNVAKHSGAKRVSLVLRRPPTMYKRLLRMMDGVSTLPMSSAANDRGGGGLGLLGIRERLGNVGGTLDVESAPGRGATLLFAFQSPKNMRKKSKQNKRRIRVMLVDDHSGMRAALRTMINAEPDLAVVAEADGPRAQSNYSEARSLT